MARLPRLYVQGKLGPGPLQIRGSGAKRLSSVLRLKAGDELALFSGDGHEYQAKVDARTNTLVTLTVGPVLRQVRAPALVVEVWCSLVRANRFDWAVEKCTEAGADIIRPLTSERSARGKDASASRVARWERIAVEASEQCGRLFIPVIEAPSTLEERLSRHHGTLLLADAAGRPWDEASQLFRGSAQLAIAIGPEGGFTDAEREQAIRAGAVSVRLGPHTLRTETAAVAATAMLRATIG